MRKKVRKSPLDLKYDVWFKPSTNCEKLDECYLNALTKFTIIFANKEVTVYKILNHYYEKFGLTSSNIKTVDGLALESYFDTNYKHAYNIRQLQRLLVDGVLSDIENKWLILPNMNQEWNAKLAFYFYNEIKSAGALGIIFNSNGKNNFGQVLVEQTVLNIVQFPEEIYMSSSYLEDDNL